MEVYEIRNRYKRMRRDQKRDYSIHNSENAGEIVLIAKLPISMLPESAKHVLTLGYATFPRYMQVG